MRNLLLLSISILISFGALEALSRSFVDLPSPYAQEDGRLVFDARGFWLNLANQDQKFDNKIDFVDARVRTDAIGLRHVSCQEDIAPTAPRVFVIGDSQTFGFGLSDKDTWISQLQCSFQDRRRAPRLVNLGVPATNIDQYFSRLGIVIEDIKQEDKVVLAITWNDIHSIAPLKDPNDVKTICPHPDWLTYAPHGLASCIERENPLYYGVTGTFRRYLYEATGIFIPYFDNPKRFLRTVVYSSALAYVLLPKLEAIYLSHRKENTMDKLDPNAISSNVALLRVFDAVVRARTSNITYLLFPSRISYVDEIFAVYSRGGTVFPEQDFLTHMLGPFCSEPKINCIGLFDTLNTNSRGVNDFAFDGHLNPKGARLVSDYLTTVLFME